MKKRLDFGMPRGFSALAGSAVVFVFSLWLLFGASGLSEITPHAAEVLPTPPPLPPGGFKVENTVTFDASVVFEGSDTPGKADGSGKDAGLRTVKSTTLFTEGLTCDFIEDNGQGEITLLDRAGDVFILIDPACRIQTRLKASEMRRMIDTKRPELAMSKKPFVAFAGKPAFDVSIDETSGEMRFQSSWVDYSVKTHSPDRLEIVESYLDFCDWACYLHCRINPGKLNPLLRLEINRTLRERKRLPDRIAVTNYPDGKKVFAKSEKVESGHLFSLRLSEVDMKRINDAVALTRQFREVPFVDYQVEVSKKVSE